MTDGIHGALQLEGSTNNKIATELASGNSYDLVISGKSLVDKKLVQPIDQYFDLEDPIFQNTKKQIETRRFGGQAVRHHLHHLSPGHPV